MTRTYLHACGTCEEEGIDAVSSGHVKRHGGILQSLDVGCEASRSLRVLPPTRRGFADAQPLLAVN